MVRVSYDLANKLMKFKFLKDLKTLDVDIGPVVSTVGENSCDDAHYKWVVKKGVKFKLGNIVALQSTPDDIHPSFCVIWEICENENDLKAGVSLMESSFLMFI